MTTSTTEGTSIAARARAAAHYLATATDALLAHPAHPAEAAAAHLRLAYLLGVPLDHVTVASDRLRRHHQIGEPLLLTVTDPTEPSEAGPVSYRFILATPLYDDDPFHLLGPCPECRGEVPLRTITTITDLAPTPGVTPTRLPFDDTFTYDPGHHTACTYGPQRG